MNEKRVLAVEQPLSTQSSKPALYHVADSNLRLYLAALRSSHDLARRGRVADAYRVFTQRWSAWRGRAVEPLIRESLSLAAAAQRLPWPDVNAVGGWWNRQFDPEIDLVGADRRPIAGRVDFAGSIKWVESGFDHHDLKTLQRSASRLPGWDPAESGLVVVSRSGLTSRVDRNTVDLVWEPRDVVQAWLSE